MIAGAVLLYRDAHTWWHVIVLAPGVRELEHTREREAELAVIRKRVRFASDLHDIQGHTLHVVKLKIALARKRPATPANTTGCEPALRT